MLVSTLLKSKTLRIAHAIVVDPRLHQVDRGAEVLAAADGLTPVEGAVVVLTQDNGADSRAEIKVEDIVDDVLQEVPTHEATRKGHVDRLQLHVLEDLFLTKTRSHR
jgi:hypothetical protein